MALTWRMSRLEKSIGNGWLAWCRCVSRQGSIIFKVSSHPCTVYGVLVVDLSFLGVFSGNEACIFVEC